jgi:hypothetical protein
MYSPQSIISVIKQRNMRWARHLECVEDIQNISLQGFLVSTLFAFIISHVRCTCSPTISFVSFYHPKIVFG